MGPGQGETLRTSPYAVMYMPSILSTVPSVDLVRHGCPAPADVSHGQTCAYGTLLVQPQ